MCFFFFNDTATTEIYTLSLHDALPICRDRARAGDRAERGLLVLPVEGPPVRRGARAHAARRRRPQAPAPADRKSTRLNSSHANISYAVFCLKKKKKLVRIVSRHHILST